jgi:hypothetical protein
MLARAETLSTDSSGKRIPAIPSGYEGIRCRETKPHALSNPNADETREEQAIRAGRMARAEAELTDRERYVLRAQGKLETVEEVRIRIPAGHLGEYARQGYVFIPGSESMEARKGLPPIETIEVVGSDVVQMEPLDCEAIATALGVTLRQVQRDVTSGHRKLREAMRRESSTDV